MKFKIKDIKKEARKSISKNRNTAVLGFFIPFLLGIFLVGPSLGITTSVYSGQTEFLWGIADIFLSAFIYSIISYSFYVGVCYIFLQSGMEKKAGFSRLAFVAFFSFRRAFAPVIITKTVFFALDILLSAENSVFLYDALLFSYFPLHWYLIAIQIIKAALMGYYIYVNTVYVFTPFILAESPFIKGYDAMRLSERISKGHKWFILLLQLSYVGWYIIGGLAFVVGAFFALSYSTAALFVFYKKIRPQMKIVKNVAPVTNS